MKRFAYSIPIPFRQLNFLSSKIKLENACLNPYPKTRHSKKECYRFRVIF